MDRIDFETWYIPLLWICFFASLTIYFQKNNPPWLKFFPPFILITVIVETIGWEMGRRGINNTLLFNTYCTLEIVFYLLALRANIKEKIVKIIIAYGAGLYVIIQILDFILLKSYEFHFVVYDMGSLLIAASCAWYFYRMFKSSTVSRVGMDPMFWICTGMSIFFTCSLPLWTIFGNIETIPITVILKALQVHVYLNMVIYSMFIFGFLCRLTIRRTQS